MTLKSLRIKKEEGRGKIMKISKGKLWYKNKDCPAVRNSRFLIKN
jgi:hypothetical protein